ncbi:MAG: hypothetical protein COS08_08475 [Euryarchaeota archaeon CG01_land_8_20_14_3_00_38_12]|nr:MAG: hypothetical protein COS08_08475 [Euryarchaeota archaeon CG01_land_8_20_14_3_00_38_12]
MSVDVPVIFAICIVLALLAYGLRALDWIGSLTALIIGLIVGVFGGLPWLIVLVIFLFVSFAATKYKYNFKSSIGETDGKKGERRWNNVIANGTIPALIAVLSSFALPKQLAGVLFITAISAAMSDTLASEIGIISDRVYLITNMKKVERGTNGGVSVLGTNAAFFGALFIPIVGWILLSEFSFLPDSNSLILIPILIGFLGCQIDSVLGATLEGKILTKDTVNLVSISVSVLIAWVILWITYC